MLVDLWVGSKMFSLLSCFTLVAHLVVVRGVVSALVAAVLLVTTFTDTTDLQHNTAILLCRIHD